MLVRVVRCVCSILITGVLSLANRVYQPCEDIWAMNHYRTYAYGLNCWIAVSAFVGVIMLREGHGAYDPLGTGLSVWLALLVVGGGLLVAMALLVHASQSGADWFVRRAKRFALSARMSANPLYGKGSRFQPAPIGGEGGGGGKASRPSSNSLTVNPLNLTERMHAMTMDIELAQQMQMAVRDASEEGGGAGGGGGRGGMEQRNSTIATCENPLVKQSQAKGNPLLEAIGE